jgi:teichuronic acid biosynthesis glycosyltransferase TuaG
MCNSNILVSVITPLYNKVNFIEACIESVLLQTHVNWEMIIIDDRSSDGSYEKVLKFASKDKRIKVYQLENNSGAGLARNYAIDKSVGSFVAFLDSDDIWHPDKLKIQLEIMINCKAVFSHTSYGYILKNGLYSSKIFKVSREPIGYKDLLKRTEISCLTAMYDVRILGKIYMPNISRKQDYALWLSILSQGHTSLPINLVLAWYRQVDGSNSSNKISLISKHYFFLRRTQNLSVLDSVIYTFYWGFNGFFRYFFL